MKDGSEEDNCTEADAYRIQGLSLLLSIPLHHLTRPGPVLPRKAPHAFDARCHWTYTEFTMKRAFLWIIVAAVAGILLANIPLFATTHSFRNDTGKVATGIKVEFSRRATVTRHSASFALQDPDGWGTKFTFTGGKVQPGGKFTVSWGPSAATVVSWEWIAASVSAASVERHTVEKSFAINLKSDDGHALAVQVTRKLSERMIPFMVEYAVEGEEELAFTWDMNHLVDSDGDGQFRNDADAVGKTARMIYPSNRTPYIVTLWAKDGAGKVYRGEDEISFNVQNGDKVLLDANGFTENAVSVEWSVFNGDAKDTNIRIEAPAQARTALTSTYPDVTKVSLETSDPSGNTKEFDTTLYVFNKNPERFKYRGLNLDITWIKDIRYVARNLDFIKAMGVNYIRFVIEERYYINNNGVYVIHKLKRDALNIDSDESALGQVISMAHQRGLGVELGLESNPDPGVADNSNHVPMSEKFFEGPQGYFAFLQHYIGVANQNDVEALVGKTEMSSTDFPNARPWMDKLIEMMKTELVDTRYTVENFFGQWDPMKPWDPNYGVDLSKLDEIEWSAWHPKVGPYAGASIRAIRDPFEKYVLPAFVNTHNAFPDLKQVIGEFGFYSAKGGEISMPPNFDPSILDYNAQKKGYAAVLRALFDFISSGNDYLAGLFPSSYYIMRAFDLNTYALTYAGLFGKPALEEIYAFYSSKPQELPDVGRYCIKGGVSFYIDPFQDVKTIKPSGEAIQDFEHYNSYVSMFGIKSDEIISVIDASLSKEEAYHGQQSFKIHYETPIGDVPKKAPYALGGESIIVLNLPLQSWDNIDSVSLAIKRENPNLGIILFLFPKGSGFTFPYVERLPLNKVGKWENIGVLLDNFSRIHDSNGITTAVRNNLFSKIGIGLYSINGAPVDTDVYIDDICVGREASN